jgi:integrase
MKGLLKRGRTWYIRYTVNGKRKWEAIGTSKRRAEIELGKRWKDIEEGTYVPTAKGRKWTYSKLLERYLQYAKVTKKPSTYETDTYWAKHLREAFGSYLLKDISPDKVTTYLENKLSDGLKPATVAHHLALLKHSFTMAVKWGLLPAQPLRDVRLPVKVNNARLRYLSPDEIDRLLSACPSHLKPIVLTGLHTGMRKGEIVNLRWEQVDLPNRVLLLTDTKNGEQRGIPLNQTMTDLLSGLQASATGLWVFPNPRTGQPYRKDADTAWYTALKKAGLQGVHFHDLRHTTGSHLRMQGADLLSVQEILGHKDLRMTARYAHVGQSHKLAAVGLLEKAYGRTPTTENGSNQVAELPAALEWQQKRQQTPETPLS